MQEVNTQIIKSKRQKLGLSQAELAVKADMAPRSLAELESGRANPRLSTLTKLADILKIKIKDLFN